MVQVYIFCGGCVDFVHLFLLHFFHQTDISPEFLSLPSHGKRGRLTRQLSFSPHLSRARPRRATNLLRVRTAYTCHRGRPPRSLSRSRASTHDGPRRTPERGACRELASRVTSPHESCLDADAHTDSPRAVHSPRLSHRHDCDSPTQNLTLRSESKRETRERTARRDIIYGWG